MVAPVLQLGHLLHPPPHQQDVQHHHHQHHVVVGLVVLVVVGLAGVDVIGDQDGEDVDQEGVVNHQQHHQVPQQLVVGGEGNYIEVLL